MATGGASKQKGFYIRDLLQTSSGAGHSRGSAASPAEPEKRPDAEDEKVARGRSHEGRREDVVTVCRQSRSADGQTRLQRPGADWLASTIVSRDAAGDITGSGRTLIGETVALGFGSVIKPLPALPGVMVGAPFGLHGLPDIYRDPRLSFRIATNAVTSICRCDTQECDGNPYQHDSGYRTYKGLYHSGHLFDAKEAHPVPVPFYVRMRQDAASCDGCFKAKKCRRSRTVFTELQLMGLEKRFESQKYLSTPDRVDLAEKLGLTQIQVKTWYQNRRMKWKKQVLQSGGKEAPTKPKGRPRKAPVEGDTNASGKTNDTEYNQT